MSDDKHQRLAEEALRLKKAWLCAVAFVGGIGQITKADCVIPDYGMWQNRRLKLHIKDLEDDFESVAKHMLTGWRRARLGRTSRWLEEKYNQWQQSGFGIFDVGRLHDVERQIGLLGHSRFMDCPPYAQVLLQGMFGAAIRHPEYHLARDLALLFNLFLDSESILNEALRQRKVHNTESSQSLARSVILTCFNLLESYVSGLATARLMQEPAPAPDVAAKLKDNSWPLRKRFIEYPALLTGRSGVIDATRPPIEPLFGECKRRRDSFVHCEPGPQPTKWGYVKEEQFHDVEAFIVCRTVSLTYEAISLSWKTVHGREQPSWLPMRDNNGRFPRVPVVLKPLDVTEERDRKPERKSNESNP